MLLNRKHLKEWAAKMPKAPPLQLTANELVKVGLEEKSTSTWTTQKLHLSHTHLTHIFRVGVSLRYIRTDPFRCLLGTV